MQDQLVETVKNLNRVNLLYKYAIRYGRPYRVAFVRKVFENMLSDTVMKFSVIDFDSKNYTDVFPLNSRLEIVIMKKKESIASAKYEIAASFRDIEIAILRSLLQSIGVAKSDRFFVRGGKIYKFL